MPPTWLGTWAKAGNGFEVNTVAEVSQSVGDVLAAVGEVVSAGIENLGEGLVLVSQEIAQQVELTAPVIGGGELDA